MYGRKIDNLIRMKEAGINVPEFTVMPFEEITGDDIKVRYPSDGMIFSVRSSCNVEDGKDMSFAGQFDTFLDVKREDVPSKIREALRSVDKETVKAYCRSRSIPPENIRMNIIVQDMIEADISGVLFTANPQGILNESVITAGRGSGEGVVSSRTDTTSYYYNLPDRIYYFEGDEDLLTEDLINGLLSEAEKIKGLFGEYLDIEFSIKDGIIYIPA